MINYIKTIFLGVYRLGQGMYISMKNMLRKKVTEQYPENRGKKEYPASFRGLLVMPHNSLNQHKCTACGICMINCPNKTIQVIHKMETDAETGKQKKVLDRYIYDLGSCTFCALCTITCPQKAIEWSNDFEHSLFTREKLYKKLNNEGSVLMPKKTE